MSISDILKKELNVKTVLAFAGVALLIGAAFSIGTDLGSMAMLKVNQLTAKKIETT